MLKISNLSFSYLKNNKVLDDVSFEVKENECVILLGPNGVGKSTLLNCILSNQKVREGDIIFDDKSIKELSFKEKADYLSYVPQLINGTDLTVKETILLGRLPYYKFYPNKDDKEKVDEYIARFNLGNIKDKCTNQISGGERQKVNIARSLIQDSKYILFDEPTSNLDIRAKLEILNIIKKEKQNHSFLISMHDINEALEIGDKFVFLKEGKIKKVCHKDEIDETLLNDVYGVKSKIINTKKGKYIIYEN